MEDWKKRIDEEPERQRRKEEEEAKRRVPEEERLSFRIKLWFYKLRFKCNVCGRAWGPKYNTGGSLSVLGYSHSANYIPLWDIPENLSRCKKCKKWTCGDHIYQGICKKCAGKL